jgi:predicted nucleic acid-binding protein
MSALVLDTSAYAAFKLGDPDATEAVRSRERIFVPAVVLGELLGGFALGTREDRNRAELEEFLASPRVAVAAMGETTAECYAAIWSFLRRAGTPVPTNDLWIAASVMEHGALLLTADAHFDRIPQIRVRRLAPPVTKRPGA